MKKGYAYKIALAGIFIALSVIVNLLTHIPILMGGAEVMRVGLGGIFLEFIAIIITPIYGGIAFALADIINYAIRPSGGFLWQMTAVTFIRGLIIGYTWVLISKQNVNFNKNIISITGAVLLAFGLGSGYLYANHLVSASKMTLTEFAAIALIVIGIIMILTNFIVYKMKIFDNASSNMLFNKIFMSIIVGSFIGTTLNTVLIIKYFVKNANFIFLWIPRIGTMALSTLIEAILVTLIITIYKKSSKTEVW